MPNPTNAHPSDREPIEDEVAPGERPRLEPKVIQHPDPDLAAVAASVEPPDPAVFTDYEPI